MTFEGDLPQSNYPVPEGFVLLDQRSRMGINKWGVRSDRNKEVCL